MQRSIGYRPVSTVRSKGAGHLASGLATYCRGVNHLDEKSASRRCAPSGLILDDGQLEPDHRTAVFAVWRKANPWGGATAGHTQIGLLAHITSGPPGIEQRILADLPFAHGRRGIKASAGSEPRASDNQPDEEDA